MKKEVKFSQSRNFGILLSFLFHILTLSSSLLFQIFEKSEGFPQIVSLSIDRNANQYEQLVEDKTKTSEEEKDIKDKEFGNSEEDTKEKLSLQSQISGADTLGLQQIYSEGTLNVRIKYPMGWTYIDQNNKGRLDGVTFLGIGSGDKEPAYVHLEVREKYLFNPAKFKLREEIKNAELFYNEPEEMEGEVTQIVYIKTKEEYDYSIKLTIKGFDNFLQYKPVFFGMIKSFKFGSSWFWEKI